MNDKKKEHHRCDLLRIIISWIVLLLLGSVAQSLHSQNAVQGFVLSMDNSCIEIAE